MTGTYHPEPQCPFVVPQKPPELQHWLLKGPPARVKPPLLGPQLPSLEGTFVVRQALDDPVWL